MSKNDIWGYGIGAYIGAAPFLFSSLEVPFFKLFTNFFEITYEKSYELSYLLSQGYDSDLEFYFILSNVILLYLGWIFYGLIDWILSIASGLRFSLQADWLAEAMIWLCIFPVLVTVNDRELLPVSLLGSAGISLFYAFMLGRKYLNHRPSLREMIFFFSETDVEKAESLWKSGEHSEAIRSLLEPAITGNREAQETLGLYLTDKGVWGDDHAELGAFFHGMALAKGSDVAIHDLAIALSMTEGKNPPDDFNFILTQLVCDKAIEDGWKSSQLTLASLVTEHGNEDSKKIGFELFKTLSQQSLASFKSRHGYDQLALAKIYFNLGYCHEHGQGTPVDLIAADKNYALASDHGLVSALVSRANLRVNVSAWSEDHAELEAIAFCEQALKDELSWMTVDLISELYLGSNEEKLRNRERAIELIETLFCEDETIDVALTPIISEKFARFGQIEESWKWSKVFQILAAGEWQEIISVNDEFEKNLPLFFSVITTEPQIDKDTLVRLTEQATRLAERFKDNRKS